MIQVKFHKYMVDYHGYNETSHQQLAVPRQRFAAYVAAEIFESARHHATYRFIVQDRLSGRDMMLVSLFGPLFIVALFCVHMDAKY